MADGVIPERGVPIEGYRRALRFVIPYWQRLIFVLLAGVAATGFGLLQPYLSKLLIDDALSKRNFRMLLVVSGLMFGVTVVGFVLNIFPAISTCAFQLLCFSTCGWRSTGTCKRCRPAF